MDSVQSGYLTSEKKISIALFFVLSVNFLFWFALRDVQTQWGNVPPAPKKCFASVYGLGDKEFAYRINSLMLQNLGDTGGRVTALKDYDYNKLTDWFFLQDKLDSVSDYIPFLASFYFSGSQDPEKFRPVLEYLKMVGTRPYGTKWKWLVQGIFFARHKLNDLDKALELANLLAKTKNTDVPAWVREMPAFVLNEKGNKREAYGLLVATLKANMDKMSKEEVNATRIFICRQVLDSSEAKGDPLCEGL